MAVWPMNPGPLLPARTPRFAELIVRSPLTLQAVIDLQRALRTGRVRLDAVVEPARADKTSQHSAVLAHLDRIRRVVRENQHFADLLASKTRKVSDGKRKESRTAVAMNTNRITESLAAIRLRKECVDRIAEQLRQIVEQGSEVQRGLAECKARLGIDAKHLRALFREAEDDGKTGQEAWKALRRLGLGEHEMAQVARLVNGAPRRLKRLEDAAGLGMDETITLYDSLTRAAALLEEPVPGKSDAQDLDDGAAAMPKDVTRQRTGQAYVEDPRVRRAIERHAMALATDYYASRGFTVQDASAIRPFDLLFRRGEEEVRVEVKGTRSGGEEVFVTAGEVLNTRGEEWRTDLFVLRWIKVALNESGEPVAAGGERRIIEGWSPEETDLIPTQYRYLLPSSD